MDKESKLNAIAEIKKQQIDLIKKATKIAALPQPKRNSTAINRAFRVLGIMLECKVLQERIKIIAQQPMPPNKFSPGSDIVGEHGPEKIILPNKTNKWKGSTFWRPEK
jgi:hypothetical protein